MKVLIDDGVLLGFKNRAKLFYPLEYGEFIWGSKDNEDFVITVIDRAYGCENDEDDLDIESPYSYGDVVNGQTLLGTIHTHPNWSCVPSPTDLEGASEPPVEQVFGIVSLSRSGNRWLTGYGFYLTDGSPVELVISKPDKKSRRNRGKQILSPVSSEA